MTDTGLEQDAALAAIDEALGDGRVTAQDAAGRELQDLALALEAETELPRDQFARALDERVAAGFPRAGSGRRRGAPPLPWRGSAGRRGAGSRPRRRGLALAGAAASLVLVIGVAVSLDRQEQTVGDSFSRAPDTGAARPAPLSESDSPPAAAVVPDQGGRERVAPGERERRIERSAELTLAAPDDELDAVADDIVRVTDRHRGFVVRSSVASGDDSARGGSFDLRVPAASLQAALADLSKLGHVRARRQAGQDITPAFVSARDRLDAARAERRSLLRRLAGADSDAEAERIRRRLDALSLSIERLRRELGALRERSDYAAVTVVLEASDGEDEGDDGSGAGGTRDALDDSLGLLAASLNLVLRALGVLIPLGLAAGLGMVGSRLLRRRRREAALR